MRNGFEYLSDGIELWSDNWKVFAAIAAPCAVLSLMALSYGEHHLNPFRLLLIVAAGLIRIVQWGAALCEVQWLQTGHRNAEVQRDAGRAFRRALRIMFVWVWLLAAVPVMAGTLLLVIPGVVIGVWLAFAPYALVYDNRRGVEALKYSRELSRGRFGAVAARVMIIGLVPMVAAVIAFSVAGTILGLFAIPPAVSRWIFNTLGDAAIAPLTLAAGGFLYRDLTIHGGAGADAAAAR